MKKIVKTLLFSNSSWSKSPTSKTRKQNGGQFWT